MLGSGHGFARVLGARLVRRSAPRTCVDESAEARIRACIRAAQSCMAATILIIAFGFGFAPKQSDDPRWNGPLLSAKPLEPHCRMAGAIEVCHSDQAVAS